MKKLIWLALLVPMMANASYIDTTIPINGASFCSALGTDVEVYMIGMDLTEREKRLLQSIESHCIVRFTKSVDQHLIELDLKEKGLLTEQD